MNAVRIYISGKISGTDLGETRTKFANMESLFRGMGFDVYNPMEKGLPVEAPWEDHMAADLAQLLRCDAIYFFDNWTDSRGAQIEFAVANCLDMFFFFETSFPRENMAVFKIKNAIFRVTGMRFPEYAGPGRNRDEFFARMLFIWHGRRAGMRDRDIAGMIHRNRTTLVHSINRYPDEIAFNPAFAELARKVDELLND